MNWRTTKNKNAIRINSYTANQIDAELLSKMELFLHEIDPSLPENHIAKNHLKTPNCEFYLVWKYEELVGLISYSSAWVSPENSKRKILVNVGGMFYSKSDPDLKNVVMLASRMHIRKQLGPFWMFKPFMAIGNTVNPRVYTQLNRFFPVFYPQVEARVPSSIRQSLNNFYLHFFKHPASICPALSIKEDAIYAPQTDISSNFRSMYSSRNKAVGDYFFTQGVFKRMEEKIFLSNKSIVVLGYYSPLALFAKFFKVPSRLKPFSLA